jgi:hypothetical protein
MVSVSGPPGIGKSRLAREFVKAWCSSKTRRGRAGALRVLRPRPVPRRRERRAAHAARRAQGRVARRGEASHSPDEPRIVKDSGAHRAPARQPALPRRHRRARRARRALRVDDGSGAGRGEPRALRARSSRTRSGPTRVDRVARPPPRPRVGAPALRDDRCGPRSGANPGQRFVGRDHVRVELRPIARKATREIARAVLGAGVRGRDARSGGAAGGGLAALRGGARARHRLGQGRPRKAPTIEAAIQVSLDALDDATRDAVVRASVFGLSVWDAGPRPSA